ncbi:MAG: hypothetical protein NWR47_03850, partial [Aestuariivirgaceae bacterium]|nr:hypothetical protein [Aestuariivirgaceae bacterium]
MSINTDMPVRVTAITQVAESVKRFRFERLDGKPFPIFPGGAHVVVAWKDGGMIRDPQKTAQDIKAAIEALLVEQIMSNDATPLTIEENNVINN